MAKTKVQKQAVIDQLKSLLERAKGAALMEFDKITVQEDWNMRKKLRAANIQYTLIKKTLFARAVNEIGIPSVDLSAVRGNIGLAVSDSDEVASAKALKQFVKEQKEKAKMIGGYIRNEAALDVLDAARASALADVPGKHELLGMLVRTLKSPITGFHNALHYNLRSLVQVMNSIAEAKKGS